MRQIGRVVFYSKEDMASVWELSKVEKILDEFDEQYSYTDIDDIIELYHIKLYIDCGVFLNEWDNSKIDRYRLSVQKLWAVISRALEGVYIIDLQ